MYGPAVECQMQNPTLPYFGDVCLVAHTGIITFSHLMKLSDYFQILISISTLIRPLFGFFFLESPDGERGEMTWNRGCHAARNGEPMGCREFSLGHNITVIECLCDSELCNEKLDLTTSTNKPTTTEGSYTILIPLTHSSSIKKVV